MSKENENLNEAENSALNIADVGGSIFFNVPLITYEKTELKLSKEEFEEFKTKTFTSDRAFFIWNKLPKDTRPELEFFMEWFYDDVHF
jgi:hypothetical protein